MRAWEQDILRVRPRLVSVARRVVRSLAEAEDTADEAIARLVREIKSGTAFVEVEAWLHRTVLHLAIDRARRFVRQHRDLREIYARTSTQPSAPSEEMERAERCEEVWRRILELPPRQQEVVILHDMEGLPYGEVARLLGMEASTARAHAYTAREELRQSLHRLAAERT